MEERIKGAFFKNNELEVILEQNKERIFTKAGKLNAFWQDYITRAMLEGYVVEFSVVEA